MFGFTGELKAAIRVTAEAEMDLPSPPFSTSDSGHPLLPKRHKGKVCYTKDMERFSRPIAAFFFVPSGHQLLQKHRTAEVRYRGVWSNSA